ncbi:2-keto-3-deoxy-phosphogluconate aldolase [Fodinibius roseus]|uniref:2-dehydro-3-deoxy-phosphogluconate aldolase n=1 Tax=Fodinibius roseus TaxID=1194090 RepID=A0A1M4TSJ9_9BACT|nr:bifunctional 4-hydroxy-2-oxoglutarate aldolase/2-dehydro-3-deoxy-phosphogluconate aldolase [Fodinibius roseus]SHE47470.1 2-keto-3-deoxy-phosphogluconate aldolase [Fodinibius roseus]
MFREIKKNKLLPAVTVTDVHSALLVAEALLEGGINVMEITFRTSATAEAIRAIARELPEMKVGAGTILSPDQLSAAQEAGAQFGLSPGLNKQVVEKAQEHEFPFIPGVSTPSDIELALTYGHKMLKLFPVSDLGGENYIGSLEGPYKHTGVRFLVMGGVNLSNLKSYLESDMVTAAGGSWLTPSDLIREKKFKQITAIVRESVILAEQG